LGLCGFADRGRSGIGNCTTTTASGNGSEAVCLHGNVVPDRATIRSTRALSTTTGLWKSASGAGCWGAVGGSAEIGTTQ